MKGDVVGTGAGLLAGAKFCPNVNWFVGLGPAKLNVGVVTEEGAGEGPVAKLKGFVAEVDAGWPNPKVVLADPKPLLLGAG